MITPKALEALDFVEIMAYDLHTAEHSPLWFARTSTEYWLNQLPKEKVVLGVPLYARPSWVQYRHLVATNPGMPISIMWRQGQYLSWIPAITACRCCTIKRCTH